jgi:hypothetical protein
MKATYRQNWQRWCICGDDWIVEDLPFGAPARSLFHAQAVITKHVQGWLGADYHRRVNSLATTDVIIAEKRPVR